ncbi:MAG: hypothetical protein ACLGIF_11565 [Actinomycetes bacterium]
MVKSQEALSARVRARRAKAELDARRAEQDRLTLDAATAFYEAAEALVAAQAAVAAADQRRAESVTRLAELGHGDEQIATLCGISVKDVRDLRRSGTQPKTPSRRSASTTAPAGDAAPVDPAAA